MMNFRKATLAVAALGLTAASLLSCAHAHQEPSIEASIDALMSDLHGRGSFNGAIVVGRGDQILYERGFGLANVAEGVPFTPETPASGGSMVKTLTAAAIAMLQEDGRIDIDDPVSKHLPEFPYPEIEIRHLLDHSSGLHDHRTYQPLVDPNAERFTEQLLLDILVEHRPPLAFPPGTAFLYSGAGYFIADLLIERVTGVAYPSFIQERVLSPLGMDSSFVRPLQDGRPQVPTLSYRQTPDGKLDPMRESDKRADFSVDFSVRDLHRWAASFYTQPLLGEETLRRGLEAPLLGGEHRSSLNHLCWYLPESGRRYYFTGYDYGFYSFAYWDADRGHSFAFISNTRMPGWLQPALPIALIDILEGRQGAPIEDPGHIELGSPSRRMPSLEDFAPILGVYDTNPAGQISIEKPPPNWLNAGWALRDGWFAPVVRVEGGLRYNMVPFGPRNLYVPGLDAFVGFTEHEQGLAIHWTRVFEGKSSGRRVERQDDQPSTSDGG